MHDFGSGGLNSASGLVSGVQAEGAVGFLLEQAGLLLMVLVMCINSVSAHVVKMGSKIGCQEEQNYTI